MNAHTLNSTVADLPLPTRAEAESVAADLPFQAALATWRDAEKRQSEVLDRLADVETRERAGDLSAGGPEMASIEQAEEAAGSAACAAWAVVMEAPSATPAELMEKLRAYGAYQAKAAGPVWNGQQLSDSAALKRILMDAERLLGACVDSDDPIFDLISAHAEAWALAQIPDAAGAPDDESAPSIVAWRRCRDLMHEMAAIRPQTVGGLQAMADLALRWAQFVDPAEPNLEDGMPSAFPMAIVEAAAQLNVGNARAGAPRQLIAAE